MFNTLERLILFADASGPMRQARLLVICLLGLVLVGPEIYAHGVGIQGVSKVYVSPVATGGPSYVPGQNFNVSVVLDLAAGESMASFDVKLNYSGWGAQGPLIKGVSVDLSQSMFASRSNTVLTDCIDGVGQKIGQGYATCNDFNVGQVEVADVLLGSGNVLTGPITGVLFTVEFNVRGSGTSIFTIPLALLYNPGTGSNPSLFLIQYVALAGVFGNNGVVAFFNFEPLVPPSIVAGGNVSFDARDSFNAGNRSILITGYSWDFGDGSSTVGSQTFHKFQLPGNYSVQLIVTDSNGSHGVVSRTLEVLPRLGSLYLSVKDNFGNNVPNAVAQLFNSSNSGLPFYNKTTDLSGTVIFTRLTPGDYVVKVSGASLVNQSKMESVQAGWQSMDTVYLTRIIPLSTTRPPDYAGLIYLGSILGGLAVFGMLFFRRRLRGRRDEEPEAARAAPRRSGRTRTRSV